MLLADSAHVIEGKRLGLITNRSGVSEDSVSSIDLLHRHGNLVALFAPEHGIRGDLPEGDAIPDESDPETGIPVYSLYGETRAPTAEHLSEIDVLLFDIQDIGARYYTYVSTMALAMEVAGAAGIPFVVLDRPNPIGGLVQGPVLDPEFASFVGMFPVPVRHGLTAGELARMVAGEFGVEVDLRVIPVAGWTADKWHDDTGLPWIAPSLNMPSLASATHYPGTCLFEGTNLSVGRGTDVAFQVLGAPWFSPGEWAEAMGTYDLPGVEVASVTFTPESPSDGKFDGLELNGVQFRVVDRAVYDPVRTAVAGLLTARHLSGDNWVWHEAHFDRLAGSRDLRTAIERGDSLDDITRNWESDLANFRAGSRPYLLYPRSTASER